MKSVKIENRIFICFVIVVLAIFLTGCNTVKWEWFPKDQPTPQTKEEKEIGEVKINVIKVSI